ncbi:SusC/RagA family TonB-linked outer membrane protein [Daejeonella oryzae]|uniref:SusC/RagA family TonB-linked outer membrane protein n=1 Tax=Daejeonella oryzae TaxID=1122943 RepID=UPI000403B799|nr:SusC/RagA family TonB-linked outer membrane protein [Daejeonella oryzae]
MKKRLLMLFLGIFFVTVQAMAQLTGVSGKVSDEDGLPLPGVSVKIKGTNTGTQTGVNGNFSISASQGQVLVFSFLGTVTQERTVGADKVINVTLRTDATSLNEVVVTALGQTANKRSITTAQQSVKGADIAQTQRENFINALQGRVAGVDVTSSSGVPGASSSITIRGVSSISGSNQPLMIIDGLPMDNKTLNTGVLASDANSLTAFGNRGVDFTNRSADINPDDIESLVVLKGPEAAALYGIDAANGAIVITTKRGKAGVGGIEYSNSLRIENTRAKPEIQQVYGPSAVGSTTFLYYGAPYAQGTQFFDNVDGFFQTALTQKHNLSFSGAAPDNKINYRVATSFTNQEGVVPNSLYDKINVTGASGAQVNSWLKADLSMGYTYAKNDQSFKGVGGPLIGLLVWPQTDDAKDYLTAAGTRRRLTNLSASSEVDNPYFNVEKNIITSKTNRILSNLGLVITPFKFGNLKTNLGVDAYINQNMLLRHPESAYGNTFNGVIDVANDVTRNISSQTLFNFNSQKIAKDITINGLLGNSIQDFKSNTDAIKGQDFLDPNFVSVNNTSLRTNQTRIAQRRLVSAFGSATVAYKDFLYLTVTGRNDWTSTIPKDKNSFFYPSISTSFIFTDAFPSLGEFMTGKLRAAYAEVGKDARPYAYRPSLEYKTTSNGGYGYGFTGPNLDLRPEFAKSYEVGTELSFLKDRLGIDLTLYRKQTQDQIVNDIRGSYATGFILFNLNGAETRNQGLEITLRGTPVMNANFSWDILTNFESARGKVLALPNALPESYVSDTWLFGNVRNGTAPGLSTRSLTGLYYLRNTAGQMLIDPTSGLPLRSSIFVDGGYDRQPDFSIGVTNTFKYKNLSLNFLVDIRKGGDVLNATEQFLTARGLSMRTLDRNEPRVIEGVLRDGKENTSTPTQNNIVVVPSVQNSYYTAISEELFIEKDINWLRLRDVTLSYVLPASLLKKQNFVKKASVFVTGTDLLLFTNYSGLDPIVNGNSAAVGGSGAAGIDYGNFPIPQGINFGVKIGL